MNMYKKTFTDVILHFKLFILQKVKKLKKILLALCNQKT